mmetsp:Transcript_10778/g.36587  ORF Transcript_10778/g.36587 Transcript_10778/m.36587 type:complete len:347 (-) Transcript_10778:306-1346(-)
MRARLVAILAATLMAGVLCFLSAWLAASDTASSTVKAQDRSWAAPAKALPPSDGVRTDAPVTHAFKGADEVVSFALAHGAHMPMLSFLGLGHVTYNGTRVRGIVTTAPIAGKSTLFAQMPSSVLLGDHTASKPLGDFFTTQGIPQFLRLVLVVLEHQAQCEALPGGKWCPYVRFLHTVPLDMPATWDDRRLRKASPVLQQLVGMMRAVQQEAFDFLARRLGPAGRLLTPFSMPRFVRAWDLVMTRHWNLRDLNFMVPVLDLFNFGNDRSYCNLEGPRGHWAPQSNFTYTALQPYRAGQQVTFYYGRHCKEELLLYYGFATPDSKPCTLGRARHAFWFTDLVGRARR